MNESLKLPEEKMTKTVSILKEEFTSIRAGRANPSVLDKLAVDYYGTPTPINQVATVAVQEARVLAIQPWDPKTIKLIEKAILMSDLGINPTNDGRVIRLVFPPLTEERRKDLVKQVRKMGEDAKVSVRAIRRASIEVFKEQKKKSEITEDDQKNLEDGIQKLTDRFVKLVDDAVKAKETDLLEI